MANKYIIHGAAFNGDGTASNEAASNGAAGAWNNINIFEGTTPAFGTLAAGDVVYIRSKDSSGADIVRTMTANTNVGSAAATAALPIVWILDDGTVWSGVNGVLTYRTIATATRAMIVRAYNHVVSKSPGNFVVITLLASPGDATYLVGMNDGSRACNLKTDTTVVTNASPRINHYRLNSGFSIVENPQCKVGLCNNSTDGLGSVFGSFTQRCDAVIINPDIELTSSTLFAQGIFDLAGGSTYPRNMEVIGGRVYGAGAQSGQNLITVGNPLSVLQHTLFRFLARGFQFPRSMDVSYGGFIQGQTNFLSSIEIIGCDDGGVGGHLEAGWGWATSRTDNNPPYLSATLPDSLSTPWSWRVWPRWATPALPVKIPTMKLWTGDAEILSINQEILVADTLTATKDNTWISVTYVEDSTGLTRTISSIDYGGGSLTSSTAPWSATVWGLVSFDKYKLQVTTPTAVKKDTLVQVTFFSGISGTNEQDILFVDPDFSTTVV